MSRQWIFYLIVTMSLLSSVLFVLMGGSGLTIVTIEYLVIIVISRASLRQVQGFPGSATLRRFFRSIVYFFPLFFLPLPSVKFMNWGLLAAPILVSLLMYFRLPELRLNLSTDFLILLPSLPSGEKPRQIFHSIMSAIAQEYFYRGVAIFVLKDYLNYWSIIVVTLLFFVEHYIHIDAQVAFDRRDYVYQSILSVILGLVFYLSGSLLGCILGHIIYNFPHVIQTSKRKTKLAPIPEQ